MMKLIVFFRRGSGLKIAVLFLMLSFALGAQAQEKTSASVEALLYSTMPSTTAHRPEMALDGDQNTFFRSAYGMGDGDEFLVLLSQAIPVQSLSITTGDADGQDILTEGVCGDLFGCHPLQQGSRF